MDHDPPYLPHRSVKTKKGRTSGTTLFESLLIASSALTGFEPALRLVDHIDAALTAHDAAIAVALLERAE